MKIKHTVTTSILLAGLSTMPFSSCSNMSRGEMVAGAAGFGALLGGVAGNIIGDNTVGTLIGAGAGALVGGLVGYVWSESIVKERSAYATSAAYVQANNQQLSSRLSEARMENSKTSSQVASIKNGSTSISKSERDRKSAVMSQNINLIEKDIQTARKASAEASGSELQQLRSQINALSAEKQKMEQNRNALNALAAI